jgi:dihydrofolate reductase
VWPTRRGDRVSDRINSLQKYAVSNSLVGPTWNNTTVIGGDVVRTIRQLKEQPGKDIVQYGLGDVSFLLMDHGLIDEIRLWVHPIILGRSGPSAPHFGRCPASRLRLTASNVLPNGIAILNYDVDQPK